MSNLAEIQKIIESVCYVCASKNPQFKGKLADSRVVSYCGDCLKCIQKGLCTLRGQKNSEKTVGIIRGNMMDLDPNLTVVDFLVDNGFEFPSNFWDSEVEIEIEVVDDE